MRVYFLKFGYNSLDENTINISQDGDLWVTPALDLYDNDSYKNFSETKSNYGLGGADAYRWVGLYDETGDFLTPNQLTSTADLITDSGYRAGGRFIDTTGRIDIVSMKVVSVQLPSVYLYNSDLESDTYYLDEWERRGPFTEADEFDIIGSQRNLKVAFDFGSEGPDEDFEAYIRVEIDRPVMAPLYRFTRQMANKFPEWMALRNLPEELDDPELATPSSIGMKFVNAVASEWLDDLNRELNYRDFQKYISTVDLTQIAWDWEVTNLPEHVVSVTGDGVELARAHDYTEYLKMRDEDVCYIDAQNDTIYVLQEYDTVAVNGVEKIVYSHQVWNYVDEIGMIVDLERLHREDNENYTKRIRDVFKNRGGVGVESLKLALRRELDLWKYEGATPDSDYEGATPEILDIEDIEQDPKYFTPDGLPTRSFVELIENLSKEFPTTWGRFIWNKAIWDIAGKDYAGYGIIPHRYDGELPPDSYLQSGVGDGEDLFVFRPDVFTGPRDFNARLKMRGRQRTTRNEYRPVHIELAVQGKGDRDFYEHPVKEVWFTVELDVGGATPGTYIHSFKLSSQSDVDHGVPEPTEESFGRYEIFSEFDDTTHEGIEFVDAVNNDPYNGTGVVDVEDIQSVTLVQGEWIPNTGYGSIETQDHFEAWFSHDPNTIVNNATPDETGISYGWSADATPVLPDPEVVMKSLLTDPPVAGTWESDEYFFEVDVNDLEPYLEAQPVTIDIPEIQWDPYVTNRDVEVRIVSTNPYNALEEEFGGLTTDQDDIQYFYPENRISISPGGVEAEVVGAPSATKPMLLDLNGWDAAQVLWLPGQAGNYASIPDVNLLDADTAHLHQSSGIWNQEQGADISHHIGDGVFGSNCLKVRNTSTTLKFKSGDYNGGPYACDVVPGQEYSGSFWVKAPESTTLNFAFRWVDASGSFMSSAFTAVASGAVVVGQWSELKFDSAIAPAGAVHAVVTIQVNPVTSGNDWYFDAFCLRTGSDPTFVPSTRIVGDLDVRAKIAVGQVGISETILGKWWSTVDTRSWQWRRDANGHIVLDLCDGSVSDFGSPGTDSQPVLPEDGVVEFRTTWDKSAQLATKYREGVQESQDATTVAELNADTGQTNFTVGQGHAGAAPSKQAVHSFELRDGIDGPIVASADFTNPSEVTGDNWTTPEGHAAQINRSGDATAELADRACWAFTGTERLQINDRSDLDADEARDLLIGGQFFTRSAYTTLASKKGGGGAGAAGWWLAATNNSKPYFAISDGIQQPGNTFTQAIDLSIWNAVFASWQPVEGLNTIYMDGVTDAFSFSDLGDGSSSGVDVVIGALSAGGQPHKGLISNVFLFRRTLTDAERAELTAWDGSVANEPVWLRGDPDLVLYLNADDPNQAAAYENDEVVSLNTAAAIESGTAIISEDADSITIEARDAQVSSSVDTISYPIAADIWTLFEAEHDSTFAGVVDENGPWRYGVAPLPGNTNYILDVFDSLTRDDFNIPNDEDHVVTWVGVDSDNSRTIVWLDSNSVKPVNQQDELEYPANAIEESIEGSTYVYDPVVVRARIKPEPDPEWYPQVHSGYFYDKSDEYYFYAKQLTETVAGSDELILSEVARQGAPVIAYTDEATPQELRQVVFFDDAATPSQLSLINTEALQGNGSNKLYLAYSDIANVTIEDEEGTPVDVGPGAYTQTVAPEEYAEVWGHAGDNVSDDTEPLYVDLEGWGSEQALLLPGSIDNYVYVPSTNMLPGNTANIQSGVGLWAAAQGANAPTLVTYSPRFGDNHLQWTSSVNGESVISAPTLGAPGTDAVIVDPNTTYSFSIDIHSRDGDKDVYAGIAWYNSSGTEVRVDDGDTVQITDQRWARAGVTTTSPVDAARGIPFITVVNSSSGDTFWVDRAMFTEGSKQTFTPSEYLQGDIDVRARFVPRSTTTAGTIFSRWTGTAAGNVFRFKQDANGRIQLDISDGSINSTGANDSGSTVTARIPNTVRATWDKSAQLATIYSTDDAAGSSAWTAEDTYNTAVSDMNANTVTTAAIGATSAGTDVLTGAILWVEIRDGIDGPVVASLDFGDRVVVDNNNSWETPEAAVATLVNGSGVNTATLVDANCWYFTGQGRLTILDRAELDATGPFEAMVMAAGNNVGSEMAIMTKKQASTGTSVGWTISTDTSGAALSRVYDGTSEATNTFDDIRDATDHLVGISRASDGTMHLHVDGVSDEFAANVSADLSNSTPIVVGSSNSNAHKFSGVVYWFAYFNAPKSDEKRIELAQWDGSKETEPEWLPYDPDLVMLVSASNPTVRAYYDDLVNVFAHRTWDVEPGSIYLHEPTDPDKTYYVSYSLESSFYVDNEYIHTDGTNRSRVVFNESGNYSVNFEASEYDPAVPVDLPLNPLYTTQTEGFVYISHNEYTLDSIRVYLNPHKLLADGHDYLLLTLESLDKNGNPKPNQDFTLSTDFGVFEETNITTDHDGFATTILTSTDTFSNSTGTIDITGGVSASIDFEIEEAKEPEPTLFAVTKSEQLPADGTSKNMIFGRIRQADFTPVPDTSVSWKRARSIYDLFTDTDIQDSGTVTTATDGSFEIGPITTSPNEEAGYWFVAIEATVNGVNIGDVVFWYEYPEASQGVENADGPQAAVQMSDSPGADPEYGAVPVQQYTYDEDGNIVTVSPDIVWSPPDWYAVSAHNKWMYGLDSNKTYTIT